MTNITSVMVCGPKNSFPVFKARTDTYAVIFNISLHFCSNGLTASGLFTAVNCIWEKMKVDQEVDIFHAVKHLRYHRKNIVQDLVSTSFHFLSWTNEKVSY